LPNTECIDGGWGVCACPGDRIGHGVSPHSQTSDARRLPAGFPNSGKAKPPQKQLPWGRHGCLARIDVESGPLTRSKGKVPEADGALAEQRRERLPVVHSPLRRKIEEKNPPFFAAGPLSPPVAAQKAFANSSTVFQRFARSRSRPVMTACSTGGGNL